MPEEPVSASCAHTQCLSCGAALILGRRSFAKKFVPVRPKSHSSDTSLAGRKRKRVDYAGADGGEDQENEGAVKGKGKKKEEEEFEEDEDGKMVKKVKRDRFGRPIKELFCPKQKVRSVS